MQTPKTNGLELQKIGGLGGSFWDPGFGTVTGEGYTSQTLHHGHRTNVGRYEYIGIFLFL